MAGIEAKGVQDLLDLIEAFKKIIESKGEEGRNRLKSIKIDEVLGRVPRKDGKVDPEGWNALEEGKKKELFDELTLIREALHAAELDGPADPKNIMSSDYASNRAIGALTFFALILTALLLWVIVCKWDQATGKGLALKPQTATEQSPGIQDKKTEEGVQKPAEKQEQKASVEKISPEKAGAARKEEDKSKERGPKPPTQSAGLQEEKRQKAEDKKGPTEGTVLAMVILLGALGGSLHLVSSLVMFIGNRQLKRSWLLYYYAMPFTGAGLAPIVYMLLRTGLINPSGASADGTAITNLNLIAIYAFAAMTGMFSRVALDKLGEVFKTLFRTAPDAPSKKDPLTASKAAGSATSTSDKKS